MKGYLIDLDGTLLDTEHALATVERLVAEQSRGGISFMREYEAYRKKFGRININTICTSIVKKLNNPVSSSKQLEEYLRIFTNPEILSGAHSFLSTVSKRSIVRIFTDGEEYEQMLKINHHELMRYANGGVGIYEGKMDYLAHELASLIALGANPMELYFLDDKPKNIIEAARQAQDLSKKMVNILGEQRISFSGNFRLTGILVARGRFIEPSRYSPELQAEIASLKEQKKVFIYSSVEEFGRSLGLSRNVEKGT